MVAMGICERPILISTNLMPAILDGRKTQTRRVWKLPKGHAWSDEQNGGVTWEGNHCEYAVDEFECPYGQPGDRLWVREKIILGDEAKAIRPHYFDSEPVRWSTREQAAWLHNYKGPTAPAIHMPRWASRITLEITDVRVERLQEIGETDAVAEGVERYAPDQRYWHEYFANPTGDARLSCLSARESFIGLWKTLNGNGSWEANPWVWVIEFRRVESELKAPYQAFMGCSVALKIPEGAW